MSQYRVVLDACVLYPQGLRDLLMSLAAERVFKAHWTNDIHDEWIRNLHANSGFALEKLQQIRQMMDRHTDDALVSGYEPLIAGLNLPDPDDRHVLAAAIKCGANAIVTLNLKDFPEEYLATFGIEVLHPDDFVAYQIDMAPAASCSAIKKMRQRWKNPTYSAAEYLAAIKPRLPTTAALLAEYESLI
ncbi:PIN domain-containing protein [Parathalassolituus penaei]|uniref:PIN domain-containing protein n=1 Tax=Parathalassolituus penaei TaxID=2997323 RepID=A0A9X3IRC7_9GAMM|nr:PIN domain-containing protein [Parathalassolituus penaei]MCY0964731.1 PIN domain-containing protein [Parathalassolituus penaei]